MTLERGTLLHKRYRIVEILGQGGMGSVYRAVDENLGVDVAVKENLFTSEEYSRQFRLEAIILAGLRHPNLPRVSDHFAVGDQGQYLVMDFIEGEDLRQRMERMGTITDDDAVMVGAAMCDALTYLHTRKPTILHRDIKPGNVKITPEGHIFLVDFGLAKLVQGSQATTTGARAMTPGYSPPEQYGTARTDARTDVYSLGATLYAALSGMIPEDGLARAMDNAQLTPLRKRNPKVSRRLAAAIEKAMAVDPADRFQTAEDFKVALLNSTSKTERATGEFTVTPPPGIPTPLENRTNAAPADSNSKANVQFSPIPKHEEKAFVPPIKRRRRSPAWLLLLFILIITCGGVFVLYRSELPGNLLDNLPQIISPFLQNSTATKAPTNLPTTTAIPSTATTQPTATLQATPTFINPLAATATPARVPSALGGGPGQIAFASDRSGIPQIYLSDLTGQSVTPITNMADGACQPSWSPDGSQLVFVSPCYISPAGRPLDISEGPPADTVMYIINADGSNPIALPTVKGGDSEPAWSPDGKRIAFTSLRDGHPLIYVLELTNQNVTRLTDPSPDFDEARQPSWSPFGNQILFAKKRVDVYQIWAVTDAGQGQQQIVQSGQKFWDFLPVWSPDGKTILFTERNSEGPVLPWAMHIPYENRNSAAAEQLRIRPLPIEDLNYSPDGNWLVFDGKSANENRDVFYATVNAEQRVRLTTDPGVDFDPAWRP
jgi:serine/threonine protein kinase